MEKTERAPRFASKQDIISAIVLGGIATIWTLVQTVIRLVEVAPNKDVPVPVWLDDVSAPLALPNGSAEVQLTSGIAVVSDMPAVSHVAVILATIVSALSTITVIALVVLLCLNLARGRFFSSRNTALVTGISAAIAIGWFLDHLFTQMASNGAIAALTEREYSAATVPYNWVPILAAIAVAAVAAAFRAGERLQRETEGLV